MFLTLIFDINFVIRPWYQTPRLVFGVCAMATDRRSISRAVHSNVGDTAWYWPDSWRHQIQEQERFINFYPKVLRCQRSVLFTRCICPSSISCFLFFLIFSRSVYSCYTPAPVSTWMGDYLWAGKPSRCVTATEVDSAFYPPWDGKMSISFRAE